MGNFISRPSRKSPSNNADLPDHHYGDNIPLTSADRRNSRPTDGDRAKARIYTILIVMSLVFLILNLIQIILIYEYNNYWWTAVAPAIIFVGFTIPLAYEWRHFNLTRNYRQSNWARILPKVGIAATVFLNIIAVEFGYLNGVAVPAAHTKIWRTSLSAHDSLPPPAMALAQGTYFDTRAILLNNNTELDQLYQDQISLIPSNQAAFTNFSHFPVPSPPGATPSNGYQVNYVLFNGSTGTDLTATNDLNLAYKFYYNNNTAEASLGFLLFDRKFLEGNLFELAYNCGIVNGDLFSAYSRSQLSIEQIVVNDEVNAIDYSGREDCERAEFRNYVTYRPLLIPYGPPIDTSGCGVDGTTVPTGPNAPEACTGSIDVQFSTMLVSTETSKYDRDRVQMLTDEGGIIGGIMFITWFLSIVNQ